MKRQTIYVTKDWETKGIYAIECEDVGGCLMKTDEGKILKGTEWMGKMENAVDRVNKLAIDKVREYETRIERIKSKYTIPEKHPHTL